MRERVRGNLVGYAALVVAIFAALGGVAVGLPGKGSVTANDLKSGSVTARAIRDGAVGRKKLGPSASPMWASVNADGTVIAQRGGAFVTHPSTGVYYVRFGPKVSGRGISATGQLTINNGLMLTAAPCAGTPVNPGCDQGFDNPRTVVVVVRGGDTSLANEPFFLNLLP